MRQFVNRGDHRGPELHLERPWFGDLELDIIERLLSDLVEAGNAA